MLQQKQQRAFSFLEQTVIPVVERIMGWSALAAVRSGLVVTMPLVFLGALAVLMNGLPLESYRLFMESQFGAGWRMFGGYIWNGTFAIMSLVMLFSIGQHMADQYNTAINPLVQVNPVIASLVSLSCLLCLIQPEGGFLPQRWIGVGGLFVAMLVGYCSSRIFLYLCSLKWMRLHLPGGSTELAIPQAFNALFPAMFTILLFAALGVAVNSFWSTSLHEAVHALLRMPFDRAGDNLARGLFYTFALQLLWFFGVHGANVLDPITHDIYLTLMSMNEAAAAAGLPLPHIMTKSFLDVFVFIGGCGASVSLAGALLLCGKMQSSRRLAMLSLVPGVFNINEVLLFGLPVILNPIMFIPFICTPVLLAALSYVAVYNEFVPGTSRVVEWTTPVLLNGYYATGSIKGSLLQVVNIGLGILIYTPFVLLSNKLHARHMKAAFSRLMERACTTSTGPLGQRCIDRKDAAGSLARSLLVDLEADSLRGGGLFLEFQPQVASDSGAVVGVESLLRWRHPMHGLVPAPIIIALAEDSVLIRSLGLRILEEACRVRKAWLDAGVEDIVMAVNFSALQLEEHLPAKVVEILQRHSLPPDLVEVEVTESSALDAGTPESFVLSRLHGMGLRIAIDDFGMGHSSLKYLKQFPVTSIKIDGAITREIVTNPICADIVASITRLCRARGMTSVAEFVENDEQVAILRRLGCDVFQGYKYSKPLGADACLAYIHESYSQRRLLAGRTAAHPLME